MVIQSAVYSIVVITLAIVAFLFYANRKLRTYDPLAKPTGIVLLLMMGVTAVDNMVRKETNEIITVNLGPYIGMLAVYLVISNISGLFAIESPTANYSVTLTLATITVFLVEKNAIKFNGLKNYLKGFFEPFVPFFIMNVLGKISPLISLSMRLFGNIMTGGVIMSIVYMFTAMASNLVPIIGQFNFIGVIVAPALHFYFDLFAGLIQTYIFISLTIAFIGKELPMK
ncbi:MAG: FoF1 ATP synthase subunit a [Erysipelotrichaceae bacterium]|nr:FoF1 ATP synthase subunit a [Erysipelotrichaceae bacterium]